MSLIFFRLFCGWNINHLSNVLLFSFRSRPAPVEHTDRHISCYIWGSGGSQRWSPERCECHSPLVHPSHQHVHKRIVNVRSLLYSFNNNNRIPFSCPVGLWFAGWEDHVLWHGPFSKTLAYQFWKDAEGHPWVIRV